MRTRFRPSVRCWIVLIAALALCFAYVGSYHRLSRRGLHEAKPYGIDGFSYVPIEEAFSDGGFARHVRLAIFYGPLNLVDRRLFAGESPIVCIMRLTGWSGPFDFDSALGVVE